MALLDLSMGWLRLLVLKSPLSVHRASYSCSSLPTSVYWSDAIARQCVDRRLSQRISSIRPRTRPICTVPKRQRLPGVEPPTANVYCTAQRQLFPENQQHTKSLSTTPRRQMSPLFWVFVKPLSKIWAIVWGRSVRKWWAGLTLEKQQHFKDTVRGLRGIIFGLVSALILIIAVHYVSHFEKNPMTGRYRFMSLSLDQIIKVAEHEEESFKEQYKGKFLSASSPKYQTVQRVTQKILDANASTCPVIGQRTWNLSVIEDETNNAFVLPNGHIFVFTGLLKDTANEHQLALILGHEIAHAIMQHSTETISRIQFFDKLMIGVLAAIWILVPGDGIALVTQWFYHKLEEVTLHHPYSRELEKEADVVGLQFISRACFDVREGPAYWSWQMALSEVEQDREQIPQWLSTHPAHKNRAAYLDSLVPECLIVREKCGCRRLNSPDPREAMDQKIALLHNKSSVSHK